MTKRTIRIATRSSKLALWQANHTRDLIRESDPEIQVEIIHVSTIGDRDQSESLQNFGGMGVFTREVQKALLDDHADVAVHSLKDLPTDATEGLVLAAIPRRAPVFDALVLPEGKKAGENLLECLPEGARIGTGSLRRQAQLLNARPDLELLEIRGNVDTRLKKLDAGEYDAIILAQAGLVRLGLDERISALLEPPLMYPAVGQGALGLECRLDDEETYHVLSKLTHARTFAQVTAERSLLATLRAGCHAPVGVYTGGEDPELTLEAVVLSPDGQEKIFVSVTDQFLNAMELGITVANELIDAGAGPLLQ